VQTNDNYQKIPIEKIILNKYQPRMNIDENNINQLAESIKKFGIIHPLAVRKQDELYELISGQRRLSAAKMIGLQEVPAVILQISEEEAQELALTENLQRSSLTAIEEAKSYQQIIQQNKITKNQLAEILGQDEQQINQKINLLTLEEEVQKALQEKRISEGHAKVLLKINKKEDQIKYLQKIIKERLTVKQVDDMIKQENEQQKTNVEEMEINEEAQKALSSIDIVEKESETFNDTEKEIVEDNNMDKTQMINIEEIKKAAQDINQPKELPNIDNLLKTEHQEEKKEEKPRFSFAGKFFPSLEDEDTNMDTGLNSVNPANNVEISIPTVEENIEIKPINVVTLENEETQEPKEEPIQTVNEWEAPQTEAKEETEILNLDQNVENLQDKQPEVIQTVNTWEQPQEEMQEQNINNEQTNKVEEEQDQNSINNEIKMQKDFFTPNEDLQEDNFTQTSSLEQPIQQEQQTTAEVESNQPQEEVQAPFLPDFEEQQYQPQQPKTNLVKAIELSRKLINDLETNGYKTDFEELDLPNEYQIIIKIEK